MNAAQFWSHVEKTDTCWIWNGAKNNSGYGTLVFDGKSAVAHRVAAFLHGLVPTVASPKDRKGSGFVLHECDNPTCCNPEHFSIGTYRKNNQDAYNRGRKAQPQGDTHVNAKLTAGQVAEIRIKYRHGVTRQVDLAREFGVSQRVISLVVRGETYRCG